MKKILAISSLTLKQAGRNLALLILILFTLTATGALLFLEALEALDKLILLQKVSQYIIFFYSCVTVIFLSTRLLPEDFEFRYFYTVFSKPVRTIEILLGRILGVSFFVAILVIVMTLISWLVIQSYGLMKFTEEEQKTYLTTKKYVEAANVDYFDQQKTLDVFRLRQRIASRLAYPHEPSVLLLQLNDASKASKAIERLREISEQNYGWSASASKTEQNNAIAKWNKWWATEKYRIARNPDPDKGVVIAKKSSRNQYAWTFTDLEQKDQHMESKLSLFITGNMANNCDSKLIWINPKTDEKFEQTVQVENKQIQRFIIPKQYISDKGKVTIVLEPIGEKAGIICGKNDVKLIGNTWPYIFNLFKNSFFIICLTIFLIMVGVTVTTFCSTPVAIVLVISITLGGFIRPFVDDAIERPYSTVYQMYDLTDLEEPPSPFWSQVIQYYYKTTFSIIPNFNNHDQTKNLIDGRSISFQSMWASFQWLILIRGSIWILLGFLILRKKELLT